MLPGQWLNLFVGVCDWLEALRIQSQEATLAGAEMIGENYAVIIYDDLMNI